jgi:DNA-directed RNA polymerase specialized sigma24 family protein
MDSALPDPAQELRADAAWLRRLALGLAGDLHRGEDLAQEAWVAALERPGGPPAAEDARRAWLTGVLRHLASKARRGAGRRAARRSWRSTSPSAARSSCATSRTCRRAPSPSASVSPPAELDAGRFEKEFEVEVTAEQAEPLVLEL